MQAKTIKLSQLSSVAAVLAHRGGKIIKKTHESQDLQIKEKAVDDPFTIADVTIQKYIISNLEHKWPGLRIIGEEDPVETENINVDIDVDGIDLGIVSHEYLRSKNPDYSEEVLLEDLTVWVDPIDATREFTKGQLNNCTTLIGISLKGQAFMGIIHWPFVTDDSTYSPRTFVGSPSFGTFQFDGEPITPKELQFYPAEKDSQNPDLHLLMTGGQYLDEIEKMRTEGGYSITHRGGAGYKLIRTALKMDDIYVHLTAATKKWDTCAGHAILKALGGEVLDRKNKPLTYYTNETVRNEDGIIGFSDWVQYEKVKQRLAQIPRLHQ